MTEQQPKHKPALSSSLSHRGFSRRGFIRHTALVITGLVLAGCSHGENSSSRKKHPPVAIHSGDECHLCGMLISRFPGPKGEAYEEGAQQVYKFCSTRDLFAWYLQPENKINAEEIYVQDMGATPWNKPGNKHMIPARTAWYVVNSDKDGAMGPTLGSFSSKKGALAFQKKNHGELKKFNQITLHMLTAPAEK